MADAVVLQQLADLYGLGRRVAGVGIHQQGNAVTHGLAHGRDDLLRPAGPFILSPAAFGADPEFEGVIAQAVAQAEQARGFVLRRDIALHGGAIGPQAARRAADQLTDRLSFQSAPQVPKGGIQPANRAPQIGSGKLVLFFRNDIDQIVDIIGSLAKRIGRDLPVQHLGRNVGMVRCNLSPPDVAPVARHFDKADKLVGEGFYLRNFHVSNT